MRRLIAALAVVALALGFTLSFVASAEATVTAPAANTVLKGQATLSSSGVSDGSLCVNGNKPRVTFSLINSANVTVYTSFQEGTGAKTVDIKTQDYPNGAYTVRVVEARRSGTLFCSNPTPVTTNVPVTIANVVDLAYTGATSGAQNTVVGASAILTDPNLASQVLPGRSVTFTLAGGTGGPVTAGGTTNAAGVVSTGIAVNGPPRTTTITATFASTPFYAAKSVSVPFTVTKNATSTILTQPSPVVHGQATSFTAAVVPTNGTSTPTGTVQFTVDGSDFGAPVPVGAGGVATSVSTSTLSTDTHLIGAVYSGDDNLEPSTAAAKSQVVDRAATSTVLTSSGSPTRFGQAVTFSAQVSVVAPGAGQPTGGVQFNIDGAPFGTARPLVGDTATLTVSSLTVGNHDIEAVYGATTDFASSSSATLSHGVDLSETAVDLTSSSPTAVAGQTVNYTAAVTAVGPGAGDPGGTVQFAVNGVDFGAPQPVQGGVATSPGISHHFGTHLVTAVYSGDAGFAGSSDGLDQNVVAASTTTALSTSPNPSVFGQPVVARAEVTTNAPGSGTPEGIVQFSVDGVPFGAAVSTDAGGVAELPLTNLEIGSHTVSAKFFSGNDDFKFSNSNVVTQQVNQAATATAVVTSGSPSVYGQPVTFTATVSVSGPGAGAPSGTITFADGATPLGTFPVNSGTNFQASVTTSSLSVSQHAITATYSGDGNFLGSNSSVIQKVNRAQTSTVVVSSNNPAQTGQPVTFSATVLPVAPGAGLPTGTVRFSVNGANLGGPVTLSGGAATSPEFASLSPGTYVIRATYSGDPNFVTSVGLLDAGVGQGITKGSSVTTLASSNPSSVPGEPVTFTSTVKSVAPATGQPSGVVQIWEGSVLVGATSLSPSGPGTSQATFVTSTLSPGTHSLRAVYVGNFNFTGSQDTTAQSVGQVATVTGIQSSKNPSTFGDAVTLTGVVTPTASAPGSPTGTVTFTEGGAVLGTAPVTTVGGQRQASITLDSLSGGTHEIKATYSGDATYGGSSSAAYAQVVQRAVSTLAVNNVIEVLGDNGGRVRATLTGNDGAPLSGQTVTFSTSQTIGTAENFICSGITNSSGQVQCSNSNLMPGVIVNGGFDGHFVGNADYLPADDHAVYVG